MKLYLGDKCWDKLFELPKNVQLRVRDFQKKFKENPFSPAINLEKIATFEDDSLRTARIDDTYRAIIGVASGDTYCLLYIDHHDEAMRWAQHKRFAWNSYTNSFQVTSVTFEDVVKQQEDDVQQTAFSQYSDEQLLRIGVPEHQLALVRSIKDMDDLEKAEASLSGDVFEYLFYLMEEGTNIDNIITEVEAGKEQDGDSTINNKRNFIEITDDEELERVIAEGTEKWQIFLHPSQRLLVEKSYAGSLKVTGGGGTGKTVAAIHRLKKLTDKGSIKSVLYTTFTRTLIKNISSRVRAMGIKSENCVIENIDKLALDMAKSYGLIPQTATVLDYGPNSRKSEDIWDSIIADNLSQFDTKFLKREYLDVIVYNNNKTIDEYYRQSRTGRMQPVNRKQRTEIWGLVEQYIARKKESQLYDRNEIFNLIANHLNENGIHPFEHVIADEIQDFSNPELRFLRALVAEGPDDLFLVGDPYQRIYNNRKIAFTQVGINVRGKRSKRLRVNYRTTEEIKRAATNVVKGCSFDDFDGSPESLAGYVSLMHGDRPEYKVYDNRNEEISAIVDFIRMCRDNGIEYKDIVVASYLKESIKPVQDALHRNNIPYRNLMNEGTGNENGVNLSSFHNMKGLEFKVVILSDVNKKTFPHHPYGYDEMDEIEKKNHLMNQKALMYVAITRAMQKVLITGSGTKADL
ncbi:MAG: 3'-5' exonuclease [Candidatus Cryptobacteroides sp.]